MKVDFDRTSKTYKANAVPVNQVALQHCLVEKVVHNSSYETLIVILLKLTLRH